MSSNLNYYIGLALLAIGLILFVRELLAGRKKSDKPMRVIIEEIQKEPPVIVIESPLTVKEAELLPPIHSNLPPPSDNMQPAGPVEKLNLHQVDPTISEPESPAIKAEEPQVAKVYTNSTPREQTKITSKEVLGTPSNMPDPRMVPELPKLPVGKKGGLYENKEQMDKIYDELGDWILTDYLKRRK